MGNRERRHNNKIVYGEDSVTKTYDSNIGFERELLAYKVLNENNFPLTKIIYIYPKNRAISFEKINHEYGLEKLSRERVKNASRVLYNLHNMPINEKVSEDISDPRFPIQRFSHSLTNHVINKYVGSLKNHFDMGNLESTLNKLGSKLKPEKFSYTWFDAKMRHFFFNQDDTVKATIDFEYFGIFDPLVDVGNLLADVSELGGVNPRPFINAILENYLLNKSSLEILPFYMITSKLTQALCIDLPNGDIESATKAVELSKIFTSQDLF